MKAPGHRSKVISDPRILLSSSSSVCHRLTNEAAAFTFGVSERHLLPPPQAQVGPLQLLGHQGVELQGGPEPSADLVLVLDLQHGPGAAQILHHRLSLLQQLVAVYRPLWRQLTEHRVRGWRQPLSAVRGSAYLLSVQAWRHPAVLGVRLVDLGVGVQQALHGPVPVERRHVEEHLSGVEGEEEGTAGGDRETVSVVHNDNCNL